MSLRKDMLEGLWPGAPQPSIEGMGAAPGFRPARSPAEARAEETTRVAREMTDTAAEKRHAKTAELKQARLDKQAVTDAEAQVEAEAEAAAKPKPRKSRAAKA
jgi:hypothetical protein